jgi:hypothetical protein
MSPIGTGAVAPPWPVRVLGAGKEAGLLVLVMLAVPVVVLAVGMPIALAIRLVLQLLGGM